MQAHRPAAPYSQLLLITAIALRPCDNDTGGPDNAPDTGPPLSGTYRSNNGKHLPHSCGNTTRMLEPGPADRQWPILSGPHRPPNPTTAHTHAPQLGPSDKDAETRSCRPTLARRLAGPVDHDPDWG